MLGLLFERTQVIPLLLIMSIFFLEYRIIVSYITLLHVHLLHVCIHATE